MPNHEEAYMSYIPNNYSITIENKDKSSFCAEKEKFLKFYNRYITVGRYLGATLESMRYFSIAERKQTMEMVSPAFMQNMQRSLWTAAVTHLDAFYRNDDLSFPKFFNYVKANYNKIFTGDFYVTVSNGHKDEITHIKQNKDIIFKALEDCKAKITAHQSLIDKLSNFRNNVFAHFSADKKGTTKGKDIELDELFEIFTLTEDIINSIGVFYNRQKIHFITPQSGDVINIDRAVDTFFESQPNLYKALNMRGFEV